MSCREMERRRIIAGRRACWRTNSAFRCRVSHLRNVVLGTALEAVRFYQAALVVAEISILVDVRRLPPGLVHADKRFLCSDKGGVAHVSTDLPVSLASKSHVPTAGGGDVHDDLLRPE